jgi:glycosyltransferase involved in cell wall biosynthesis
LPVVADLEKDNEVSLHKKSRVKNGKLDISSYKRAVIRFVYRGTIGKYFINKASGIGVISDYEKNEINKIYVNNKYKFFYYKLGAFINSEKQGKDKLPNSDGLIKLIIWSRADYYYKGIDRALLAIKDMKKEKKDINFKLYIVGPDYNNGYLKINNFIDFKEGILNL